jgi:hypothetical protein
MPTALATASVIGTQVVDGDITWELVETGYVQAFTPPNMGQAYFDPMYMLQRCTTLLNSITDVEERWVFYSNGQSDVQGSLASQNAIRGWYSTALNNICDYFVAQGFNVAIGLSSANPDTIFTSNAKYRWDTLNNAWSDSCIAKVTAAGVTPRVIRGANLYTALGVLPPVYPESGLTIGVHLTDNGMVGASKVWFDALIAGNIDRII